MKIINSLEKINISTVPCVVALGTFDGFHLGHQDVIKTAWKYAKEHNYQLAVFTFANHPFSLIHPQLVPSALITPAEKISWLEKTGVDILLDIPFDNQLASLSPLEFINKLRELNFRCLVVGENFSFGHYGQGTIKTLQDFSGQMDFELLVRPLVKYNGTVVSSTEIRRLIKEGNIRLANIMLKRKYSISGIVVKGNQRGRTLDFPTANIELSTADITVPHNGVYAVKVYMDGHLYNGMANIGVNPTFGDVDKIRLEVNIFDFHQQIYGKHITVRFCDFIRPEQRFGSIQQLIAQIKTDKNKIREVLKNSN